MAPRTRKRKFIDPGATDTSLQSVPFTPVPTQSVPFTPAGAIDRQPREPAQRTRNITTSDLQRASIQLSALSGQPFNPNRVNKFFLPQGEVTEEEFRRSRDEARITTEQGGRSALGLGGGLLPETREDLLEPGQREFVSPEIAERLAEVEGDPIAQGEALPITEEERAAAGREGARNILTAATLAALTTLTIKGTGASKNILSAVGLAGATTGITSVQRGKIAKINEEFSGSKDRIDGYINLFKSGQLSYSDAAQQINMEWQNVLRHEKSLKIMSQDNVLNLVGGASDDLAAIEEYRKTFREITLPELQSVGTRRAVGLQ